MSDKHLAALGWAVIHPRTREAFRRSTGEDIAPALDRYREWLEANLIGNPDDELDDAEAA
ncbi:hypothetical protein EHS39_28810 [Ensifer sp. MPMI2T]|nr:hypothetical protein EHS39_28810 [Ensifer sp. MPMI2T]